MNGRGYERDQSRFPALISLTPSACWSWAGTAEEAHRFTYTFGETGAEIHLYRRCEGYIEQDSFPTDSEEHIEIIPPVMIQIELALEQQCGVSLSKPEETCWGAVCPWELRRE